MTEKVVFEPKPARYRVEVLVPKGPKMAWELSRFESDLEVAKDVAQHQANWGNQARVIDTEARS